MSNILIIKTQAWISEFIIKYKICPFAQKAFNNNRIYYALDDSPTIEGSLNTVYNECQRLDGHLEIETTIIIYPDNLTQFDQYLDFVFMAEELLLKYNYEGVYQLASFHPEYNFRGENVQDPVNYTNRSPYPMLHIIRESSIDEALKSYSNPEQIPNNNKQLLRHMGIDKIEAILHKLKAD